MALIKCVDCGKEISDKSEFCIHCGCPIKKKKVTFEGTVWNSIRKIEDELKNVDKRKVTFENMRLPSDGTIIGWLKS